MTKPFTFSTPASAQGFLLSLFATALLSACGGGSDGDSGNGGVAATFTASVATDSAQPTVTTTQPSDAAALPQEVAKQLAQPAFHVAPVLLDEPDDTDAVTHDASARRDPRKQVMPTDAEGLSTQGLTVGTLKSARDKRARDLAQAPEGTATPLATGAVVATYSPAQIRAAYGLPSLPAAGATLTPAQAALLGAGQTIYIVDAMHNPNVAAELSAFNQKFGLSACTTKAIATTASLPLAAPSARSCDLSVVYSTASGTMTSTAPAYNAGWATEIALDVQWAHATAPLARIVLIEAADASLTSLLGAIKLATAMGPGVVSMSFGSAEGNWTASVDAAFSSSKMNFVAASGDSGNGVSWPAVSPYVVAVGGTTLTYSGTGARSEISWAKTGGGISAYTAAPSYQTNTVPGMGTVTRRNVPDVAFNADPTTGQYVAVMTPGSTAVNWISAGGTSLSAPQWAGMTAVANAYRALNAKTDLTAPHATLYKQIAAVPGTYASAFTDISRGTNGTCGTTCTARVGYDPLTGLGTPNGTGLLSALLGATVPVVAPVVTVANVSGAPGKSLSIPVSLTSANTVTFTLTGAPTGMSISSTGVINWASPVVGTYNVTVTAKDSKTGLTGQAVCTVTISAASAPAGPVITAAAMTGVVGKPMTSIISISAPGAAGVSVSIAGAPIGMQFSVSGLTFTAYWPSPKLGSYTLTVSVQDSAGRSAQKAVPVTVTAK